MLLAERFAKREPIPFDQYPLRPGRLKGESVMGWVHRFFAVNGAAPDPIVAYLMSRVYWSRWNWNECRSRLLRVFGHLGGESVARCFGELAGMQYCPACLLEWPFHQQLWDYKGIQACPRHQCELVQGCPHCGRDLSGFALINGFLCECGKSMVDVSPVQTHPIFSDFSRVYAAVANIELPYEHELSGSGQNADQVFEWRKYIQLILRVRYRMRRGRTAHTEHLNAVRYYPKLSYREMRFAGYPVEKMAHLHNRALSRCYTRNYSYSIYRLCYVIRSEMLGDYSCLMRRQK